MLDRMSGERTPVERFNGAWQRFERYLKGLYPPEGRQGSDSEAQIRRAVVDSVVTREQGQFLDACRRVRNAFTHVSFDEYDGPAAAPPQPVVVRLERLVRELVDHVRLKEVTKPALTCRADHPLQDVLREMKEHDYTQVPYHLEGTGWVLLTRDQVARWVEDSAQENLVMVDLHTTVGELAQAVGPVVTTVLTADSYVADALVHLEWSEGEAYPAVIVDRGPGKPPGVLTAWDTPELYRRLGR
jgi:CBS domain-containing protein